MLETKALSAVIVAFIDPQAPCAARERMRFILRFLSALSLRSPELLGAPLSDFQLQSEDWVLQVHGKGAKNTNDQLSALKVCLGKANRSR